MNFKTTKYIILLSITLTFFTWLYKSDYISYIDYKVYDFFSKHLNINSKDKEKFTPSVVIVNIDQKSIDALGQWPWPRIITANLINKLSEYKPSAIGLNMLFRNEDKSSISTLTNFYKNYMGYNLNISGLNEQLFDNDILLEDALKTSNSVLSVYLKKDSEPETNCDLNSPNNTILKQVHTSFYAGSVVCNLSKIQKAASNFGFINASIDKDGVLRRTPLFAHFNENVISSFALANLLAIDKNIEFPAKNQIKILEHSFYVDDSSNVLLHFYKPDTLKKVSAIDVLEGKVDKNTFAGKIVLIGTSLISNSNQYRVTSGMMRSGTDISATTIENILNDHLLYQPIIFKNLNLLFALFLSFITMLLLYKKRYQTLYLSHVTILLLSFLGTFMAFKHGVYISSAYLWVPLGIHFFLIGFVLIYINDIESKRYYQELSTSHSAALDSMVFVAGTKDFETGEHLNRTKEYMKLLAQALKDKCIYKETLTKKFMHLIYHSAPLHDIGKVGIPDAILKKPGKLTSQEYEVMKEHPKLGMQIIANAMQSNEKNDFLQTAYNIAYYHHEAWDGSGYPNGLKGDKIPLEARLMALVDVYDALTTKRCYKEPYSFEKSENIIIRESGKYFDPKLVEVFIQIKEEFRKIADSSK